MKCMTVIHSMHNIDSYLTCLGGCIGRLPSQPKTKVIIGACASSIITIQQCSSKQPPGSRADRGGSFAPLHVAGQMLLPLGREAAYLALERLEVRVLHGVCLEVLTLRRSCKTTNTAELRNRGSFTLRP